MKHYCKLSIGYDEIQFTLQNDVNADLIYVLHRTIVGAKEYIFKHLDTHEVDINKMGKIHFEGRQEEWVNIKKELLHRLRYF